ncbi:hypothetical protein HPC49_34520 [Pyxidicoccus fallax]|uniref:Uncharacterized protein n=1 Tax=Pyxidicoccus fallax TaxID=394095 RepID=A0A848LVM7_9BACT|nr:hypothetical protein [Pyxidicoccus fallax]NMO21856.1 hypothetical protein [Pyxidicoccus fallax]NPC83324.1 hypothetical protein [Pyxidicoccus fallax]
MSRNVGWFRRWSFDESVRRGGTAVDLWTVRAGEVEQLVCGTVVDAPNGFQSVFTSHVRLDAQELGWDGSSVSVWPFLRRLEERVFADVMSRRILSEAKAPGGVSIGGVAFCTGDELVAFRLGRFRVFVGGQVALWEQTVLRNSVAPGARPTEDVLRLLQGSPSVWPLARMGAADVLPVSVSQGDVRVVHDACFGLTEQVTEPMISIEGVWRGPGR